MLQFIGAFFVYRDYKEALCVAKLDFKLEALLLWIMFFFESLSIRETTVGNILTASFFLVRSRNFLIALRVVLCWKRFKRRFLLFERIRFKADLWFAIIKIYFVARRGVEPLFPGWKPGVLTDRRTGQNLRAQMYT